MPDYVGGRAYYNRSQGGGQVLPRIDGDGIAIRYQEWDVNPRIPGQNRGRERLVTGSDGSAYYTNDHYNSLQAHPVEAMEFERLLSPEGPWLHQLVVSESGPLRPRGPPRRNFHPGVTCRTVRGSKARSTQGLFDEFAAALQFPCYFGENWNAFDECLADLEWLPGDAHIFIISHAVHVLEDEPPGSFVDFLELVERVARERSEARPDDAGGQGPKPFHVVLHAEATDGPALELKLEASGVPYDLLH